MIIKGLQKLTLLDYPGKIACTVFTSGCNMRCPYCHNAPLVLGEGEEISTESLLDFLRARVGRLEGVCISGGEPTLHSDLPELISSIKELGFSVKLDTNGTNPDMLLGLIDNHLIDYVAMDIKNSLEKYSGTAGLSAEHRSEPLSSEYRSQSAGASIGRPSSELVLDNVRQSAEILMQNRVEYEFRTTVTLEHHSIDDFRKIGEWLSGARNYYLQAYRGEGDQLVGGFTPPDSVLLDEMLRALKKHVPSASIRG